MPLAQSRFRQAPRQAGGVNAALQKHLEHLEAELAQAHKRINLTNQRIAQIEHFCGMRRHTFEGRDDQWNFGQVHQMSMRHSA